MRQSVASGTFVEKCQEITKQINLQGQQDGAVLNAQLKTLTEDFVSHEKQLKEQINWKRLGRGVDELCENAGLTAYGYPAFAWFLGTTLLGIGYYLLLRNWHGSRVCLSIALSSLTAGFLYYWLGRRRIKKLSSKVQTRLMQFVGENVGEKFPLQFKHRQLLGSGLVSIGSTSFKNVEKPITGFSLGFFIEEECIGYLVEQDTVMRLSTFGGNTPRQVKKDVLPSDIHQLMRDEAEFIAKVELAGGKAKRVATLLNCPLQMDKVSKAWSSIVLNPDETGELARALVAFAMNAQSAPRGILLKGPPGTGKSIVAKAFADSSNAYLCKLTVADLKSKWIGESGQNVMKLWDEARTNAPSIIFVDECEGVFAKRGSAQSDSMTNEVVQNFLTHWDGIGNDSRVLVIGATNRAELLDDAIISRFTDVIELLPADANSRPHLVASVARQVGIVTEVPQEVVSMLGGMSGRELRNVMEKASRIAMSDAPLAAHYEEAIKRVRGKGGTKVASDATWEKLVLPAPLIGRLQALCEMVRDSEVLTKKGIPVSRTLLLHGPPGTGKTQIARTLANEAGVNFVAFSTADLKGQYLGHAANAVKQAFETARASSPSIVFIDEIDALTSSRCGDADNLQKEALVQLLQELDGIASNSAFLLVVAATNVLNQIDPAILSRFAQKLEIGLPTAPERVTLLRNELEGRPVKLTLEIEQLAARCDGYSGRHLRELVAEAFNLAVQRVLNSGGKVQSTELTDADMELAMRNSCS